MTIWTTVSSPSDHNPDAHVHLFVCLGSSFGHFQTGTGFCLIVVDHHCRHHHWSATGSYDHFNLNWTLFIVDKQSISWFPTFHLPKHYSITFSKINILFSYFIIKWRLSQLTHSESVQRLPVSFSPTSLWWPLIGFLFLSCTQSVTHIQTSWHKCNHQLNIVIIIGFIFSWSFSDSLYTDSFLGHERTSLFFSHVLPFLNLNSVPLARTSPLPRFWIEKNTFFSSDLVKGTRNVLRTLG